MEVLKWLQKGVTSVCPGIANTWILHHDYTLRRASLIMREFLAKQTLATLPQPSYSPDLALPNFFLFV
jgi:hypothetical protein